MRYAGQCRAAGKDEEYSTAQCMSWHATPWHRGHSLCPGHPCSMRRSSPLARPPRPPPLATTTSQHQPPATASHQPQARHHRCQLTPPACLRAAHHRAVHYRHRAGARPARQPQQQQDTTPSKECQLHWHVTATSAHQERSLIPVRCLQPHAPAAPGRRSAALVSSSGRDRQPRQPPFDLQHHLFADYKSRRAMTILHRADIAGSQRVFKLLYLVGLVCGQGVPGLH